MKKKTKSSETVKFIVILVAVILSLYVGFVFGARFAEIGVDTNMLSIITYSSVFLNSVLLIIITSILIKMEDRLLR